MTRRAALAFFILLVVGGGLLIGVMTAPGPWYAALTKPSFNPPNWVFAPVWTILYVMIAVVGWRVWQRKAHGPAMKLWWGQLAINFLWSPAFFSFHLIGAALAIILGLLAVIQLFIVRVFRDDRLSAMLFVPYAVWVAFASLLNLSIWMLN